MKRESFKETFMRFVDMIIKNKTFKIEHINKKGQIEGQIRSCSLDPKYTIKVLKAEKREILSWIHYCLRMAGINVDARPSSFLKSDDHKIVISLSKIDPIGKKRKVENGYYVTIDFQPLPPLLITN